MATRFSRFSAKELLTLHAALMKIMPPILGLGSTQESLATEVNTDLAARRLKQHREFHKRLVALEKRTRPDV